MAGDLQVSRKCKKISRNRGNLIFFFSARNPFFCRSFLNFFLGVYSRGILRARKRRNLRSVSPTTPPPNWVNVRYYPPPPNLVGFWWQTQEIQQAQLGSSAGT